HHLACQHKNFNAFSGGGARVPAPLFRQQEQCAESAGARVASEALRPGPGKAGMECAVQFLGLDECRVGEITWRVRAPGEEKRTQEDQRRCFPAQPLHHAHRRTSRIKPAMKKPKASSPTS